MAKDKTERPALAAGPAREQARAELQRWERVVEILSTAATYEDEAGDLERKLAALRTQRERAEGEHHDVMERLATDREAAVAIAEAVTRKTREEIEAIYAEKKTVLAELQHAIDAKQGELVQIGRDQDRAKEARADFMGVLAEVQALRAERDQLVEKLTR